ncbi:sphingomyelin phosphodiesterase [Leptospira weilii serovar Ranarum str. ICFT]|uniref:Sphingomyelin phosphodiesterase n=1 Tax=Leptospira weilii serovar Ranarum str. ICFT TaxID=1218598 RepID=N1WU97_9LEPT|nr:sphingomyelin phosphodiesterase [Leptospira weilii]EMY79418.1 sphingomyelin phosphodiesterase [Leptospira weilii serovar Ranarum str. ICFT]
MGTPKKTKATLLVSSCFLPFFLLNCIPGKRSSYNDLLTLLLLISNAIHIDSANPDSTNGASANADSKNVGPTIIDSTNVGSTNPDSANAGPAIIDSTNADSKNVGPAIIDSTNADSKNVGPANIDSTNIGSANITPASATTSVNVGPANVEIKILSHNVFLLPKGLPGWGDWAQNERAEQIASSDHIKNQDLIVFEEVFDTNAGKILLDKIRSLYPYQTDVIGRTRSDWDATLGDYRSLSLINGGVAIVSKWPIEEKIQYIFQDPGCGADYFSNKGFVYVKIDKNGNKIHLIGTHVQAEDSECSDSGVSVRANQFDEIRNFIDSKKIPNDEIVLIAGDLNAIKGSIEYYNMLIRLNANEPTYAGIPFTWDTETNEIAAFYFEKEKPVYLDYILVSKSHFQPPVWQNLAYDPISAKTWTVAGYTSDEFSDHYPVYGFIYADSSTPKKSGHKRKYDRVSFVSAATGKKIQADSKKPNAWLKADADEDTNLTKFNLAQKDDPDSNPSCMKSGLVRIEPSHSLNYFWNWWIGGGGGNYAYYPKFKDGSNRIEIINLDERCLRNGNRIAFKDYDTFSGQYRYLGVWENGNWNGYLYLWKKSVGLNEIFYLQLDSTPERDWSADLIYR